MGTGDTKVEVLVIGGGPGGYVAAIRAGQHGLDTALVEADAVGGACLNRGCIPSKALLEGTGLAHEAATAAERGIHADPEVDLGAMVDWKDGVVEQLTGGVERLCAANDVALIEGRAEFVDETTARVVRDGEEETIAFEHAVVATGSRPIELPGFDFADEPVLDSAAALDLRESPDRLVVVGGGYVGMELSTAFARLGTDVTVLEMLDSILPAYEDDVTRFVRRRARELDIEVRTGEAAEGWRETAEGIAVETDGGEYPADAVLVAVGREPVTDTANLDAVGVAPNEDGFVETDEQARTGVKNVFAVGDVAGEPMLAHAAMVEGEVAADAVAGEPAKLDQRAIPAAVFTDPEIGTVGLTEAEAADAGHDPLVGQFRLGASGRALTLDRPDGFVRIVADSSGAVLGGQVVASEASELIAEIGLAVETGATLADVASTVHAHPTLSEAVREAALAATGEAIHARNR